MATNIDKNNKEKFSKQYVAKRRKDVENRPTPKYRTLITKTERLSKFLLFDLLGKILRIKPILEKIDLNKINKILIVRNDAIGDLIVTTPMWRVLKQLKPSLTIAVAGSFRNLPLLKCDPDIDIRFDLGTPDRELLKKEFARSRREQFDLVLFPANAKRTKAALISRRASKNGMTTIMVTGDPEKHHKIFSKIIRIPITKHHILMPDQLWIYLQSLFIQAIPYDSFHPSIALCLDEVQKINNILDNLLKNNSYSEFILINTESATPIREWGYENIYALSLLLTEKYSEMQIILTSSPIREAELLSFLATKIANSKISYFPTSTLHQLGALVRRSKLVVSADTSIIHFATAEKKPTVGFYLRQNEFLPYKVPARIHIMKPGDVIANIPIEIVFNSVVDLLENPGSNECRLYYQDQPNNYEVVKPFDPAPFIV